MIPSEGSVATRSRTPQPGTRTTLVLVGNPNCGKTTLFNALTGMRQKVGNYAGVTVERKEGTLLAPDGGGHSAALNLIDLPGLYSLTPHSPDERIARDVLLGYLSDTPYPDAIVNVVDASNLERNLYLTSQLMDLGLPVLVVLTMSDTALKQGVRVDTDALSKALGVPVVSVVAARRTGVDELSRLLFTLPSLPPPPPRAWKLSPIAEAAVQKISALVQTQHNLPPALAFAEATLLLGLPAGRIRDEQMARWRGIVRDQVCDTLAELEAQQIDISTALAEARYDEIGRNVRTAQRRTTEPTLTISDRVDRVLLHRFWGYVIFLALMYVVFQAMFVGATIPSHWIGDGVDWLGGTIEHHLPPGDLRDLVVKGIIGGVGNSLAFLPQIMLLFLFISLLEDTGYLARGAFLMDRLMSRVGLHGKSFIPLLSSYSCAIPGIMATRTIGSPRARILTILIAPLMSCSARLPVYALMIGTFIPKVRLWGILDLPALVLLSMYALGTGMAFAVAALFNRTLLKGEAPSFLMEMPPYRLPSPRTVVVQMVERAWLFLKRAGTVILSITIVLWFLASYPKVPPGGQVGDQVRASYAGQLGRAIEPVIKPLGFDWKMGIGLISAFAAREVFVSAMGTIYNLDEGSAADKKQFTVSVGEKLKDDIDPRTGRHTFTPLVAVALMVYYVLAMQCMSTVAVVRRETNGWKWPLFQIAYMTLLAWGVTFIVYQGGRALGFG